MAIMSIDELYEKYVKDRPTAERIRLVELTAHDLAISEDTARTVAEPPQRSLLELEGLGEEIWKGIDAQEYINQLRDEWDTQK